MIRAEDDGEDPNFFESIPDDDAFIPETILQDREKQRLFREIIDSLSDMQRLCVIGFYYQEQSLEEIAQELEIPVNTVKSHLRRARAKIKDALLTLEQEQGTRLYSIAPFMLLFWSQEAEACEAVSVPESIKQELVQQNLQKAAKNASKKAAEAHLKAGMGGKLVLAAAITAIVIGGAVLVRSVTLPQSADTKLQSAGTEKETKSAEIITVLEDATGEEARTEIAETEESENRTATEVLKTQPESMMTSRWTWNPTGLSKKGSNGDISTMKEMNRRCMMMPAVFLVDMR